VSQKRCKIGPRMVKRQTNRKFHIMRFWLVTKSSTLDDLKGLIRTLLQKRCVFWSPLQINSMKTHPYYQRQKCNPMALGSRNIRCICGYSQGFLWAGASNESGVVDDVNFWRFRWLLLCKLWTWNSYSGLFKVTHLEITEKPSLRLLYNSFIHSYSFNNTY